MEIILMGLAAAAAYVARWGYIKGKRIGSKKGYRVGHRHGRRRRR